MRFDPANKALEISVRELAEDDFHYRIGGERGLGWSRLAAGTEIHARVLGHRCSNSARYQKEVFVQGSRRVGEWTAIISGRLDGCLQHDDGSWTIEEFKSSFSSEPSSEAHRRQLLFYCRLFQESRHTPVTGCLVYVHLITGHETAVPVDFDPVLCEADLQRRLEKVMAAYQEREIIRARKARAAQVLPFPFAGARPGQEKLMEAVTVTLAEEGHLLAQAPTGSGKTIGALYPALRNALSTGRQLYFLTSKTMQQTLAVAVGKSLNPDAAFRTSQLRAKEKMCANGEVICHEDFCPYAKNFPEKMVQSGIVDRLDQSLSHFDPDQVFAEAKREEVCPFEVQLELARRADLVIGDYNYLFEPSASLKDLDEDRLRDTITVVDEAHNLPDRIRQIYSPEISERAIAAANDWLLFRTDPAFLPLARRLADLTQLFSLLARLLATGTAVMEIDPPREELLALWQDWESDFLAYWEWKRAEKIAFPNDPLFEIHFSLQRFLAVLRFFGPDFVCVLERDDRFTNLKLICLDPKKLTRPFFRHVNATVLMSATLSPESSIAATLGLESHRTRSLTLPPPFPKSNRKIIIVPQVDTSYRSRDRDSGRLAHLLASMADAVPGNTLVLFSSYRFLATVREKLPKTRALLRIQKAQSSKEEREELLHDLAHPSSKGILLLAVVGGMFAEGVDYPGNLLSAVFVVSPALPQVGFERELLRRYYDEESADGFSRAYLQPGMRRVIQAAGRLIRSETDRGVIALICRRFLQEPYASLLPRDWYDESPADLISRDPSASIRQFFQQDPAKSYPRGVPPESSGQGAFF